ncbi:hypothetical protein AB0D86_44350 [Streptomyces sp. NPDC048324]|uniref:hypothetical protein n=1 Tax=Streptomyces sp. NPDC048324 TaxID=3157205 RepID=UPI0034195B16
MDRYARPPVALGPSATRRGRLDGIEATHPAVTGGGNRALVINSFDLGESAYYGLRAAAGGFVLKDARPVWCGSPRAWRP